jgi:DNA-binding beta-propeller fold protein YncE
MKTVPGAGVAAAALLAATVAATAAGLARLSFLAAVYADASDAGFRVPEGIACGAKGLVVVGDTGNDRLVAFKYADRVVGPASAIRVPQLTAPARVQIDPKGDLYALDSKQRRIVRLDAAGQFKGAVAFDGAPPPATIVPKSFALDASGTMFVLDEFSGRVLVLGADGKFRRALALPADAGFITDLTADFEGNLLVLDSVKRRLYAAGREATAFTRLGGDLSSSVATMPTAIAASKGLIFVVEGLGGTIDVFGRDGRYVTRMLTQGRSEGALDHPAQICVNEKDEVFVADRDNSRVQIFQLSR